MLFNSYIFILLFLPIALLGWFGLNKCKAYRLAGWFLVGMSLCFYGYFNIQYLFIILLSVFVNYGISFALNRVLHSYGRKIIFFIGLLFNLGLIFYFKYFDFFISNINALFKSDFLLQNILLPLGISFFTFQQISFLVDRYRGEAVHYSFLQYANFITFFPQLVAGPIVLHKEMIPQFENLKKRSFQMESFAEGITQFVIGLGKKVLLADTLALIVNFGYKNVYYVDSLGALVVMLAFTLELYFDFSGYSDMAVGIGKMFRIELPMNFNSPYKSLSVKEFWKRWHITLSRFFMTYVYFPLGGSRKGGVRTLINIMIVFSLSGLWHGANWTFVIWGVLHGVAVAWNQLGIWQLKSKPLSWFLTFMYVNLTMIFFRSETVAIALRMLKNLFSFSNNGFAFELAGELALPELYILREFFTMKAPSLLPAVMLIIMVLFLVICLLLISRRNSAQLVSSQMSSVKFNWFITILFVWSFISLSQVSTFLYFNF